MSEAEAIARRWIDLYNDGTPDFYGSGRVMDLYAEDCAWTESPSGLAPDGRSGSLAALREAMKLSQSIMVDRRAELLDLVAAGERAAMRYRWSATVTADGFPFAPGTRIGMDVTAFLTVRNGLIVAIDEQIGLTRPVAR